VASVRRQRAKEEGNVRTSRPTPPRLERGEGVAYTEKKGGGKNNCEKGELFHKWSVPSFSGNRSAPLGKKRTLLFTEGKREQKKRPAMEEEAEGGGLKFYFAQEKLYAHRHAKKKQF